MHQNPKWILLRCIESDRVFTTVGVRRQGRAFLHQLPAGVKRARVAHALRSADHIS